MVAITLIKQYIDNLVNNLHKISLNEFFVEFHKQFCPEKDISFMEYFLELCDKNEDEFDIPHTKLIEYGVMTSERSSVVKEKLDSLGLEIGVNYTLQDVLQRGNSGAQYSKVYKLNNKSFKICLMRAQRRPNQPVDPIIYANYYMLLEEVHKYYCMFQLAYDQKIISMKDDKIDSLTEKVDNLSSTNNKLIKMNLHIQKQNDFIIQQNVSLHSKVDSIFNMMVSFMQATIPTWVGGSVMKNQLDILCKNHNPDKALTKLKVLYMVAFYVPYNRPVKRTREFDDKTIKFICKSNMIVYFCCTNFGDVGARIRQLDKRHGSEMYMLHPQAISLLSCEVNMERTFLEKLNIFPKKCVPSWSSKYKAFKVDIPYLQPDNIQTFLNNIALSGSNAKFQGYQMRMDTYNKSNKPKLDPKITVYLGNVDKGFFESSKPLAQLYLDSFIANDHEVNDEGDDITYCKYTTFNKTKIPRSDLDNNEYHNPGYALRKIRTIIKAFDDRDVINEMVATGIVTKADVPAINAFAQCEGIDTSEFQFPDSDSE